MNMTLENKQKYELLCGEKARIEDSIKRLIPYDAYEEVYEEIGDLYQQIRDITITIRTFFTN